MKKREILIVEDEPAVRDLLEEVLSKNRYTVVSAGSAEEALKILRERTIYVMFLDLKLPGMSGVDLCREIRKNDHMALIFAMTGYPTLFDFLDCREAGFDDYFAKPINVKLVIGAAVEAFEKLERWTEKLSIPSKLTVEHP